MRHKRQEAGFTLIEMLVALAVFSIAALALLRLGGMTAVNAQLLESQALARIAAQNLAIEAITEGEPPALGKATGVLVNGERNWRWSRQTHASEEARILQIDIEVRGETGPEAARLTVFRPLDR